MVSRKVIQTIGNFNNTIGNLILHSKLSELVIRALKGYFRSDSEMYTV